MPVRLSPLVAADCHAAFTQVMLVYVSILGHGVEMRSVTSTESDDGCWNGDGDGALNAAESGAGTGGRLKGDQAGWLVGQYGHRGILPQNLIATYGVDPFMAC